MILEHRHRSARNRPGRTRADRPRSGRRLPGLTGLAGLTGFPGLAALIALTLGACNSQSSSSSMVEVDRQAPQNQMAKPTQIVVMDFQVMNPSPQSDSQKPMVRPGILRSIRSGMSQDQLMSKFDDALVSELQSRGFNASRYQGGSLPNSGWVVQGTFVEPKNPDGTFVSERWGKQDVELTVSVDDLVNGRPAPMVQMPVEGTASGIGAPMMPNPYAAAAKFVVRQVELGSDAQGLAKQVADHIEQFSKSKYVAQ